MIKRLLLSFTLISSMFLQFACGPSTAHDLKVDLDKAAKILNTAAKTNHQLAVSGVITIAVRKQVALIIHTANDDLIAAIDVAKTLTDANFASNKAQIRTMLSEIAAGLSATRTGNAQIDALLQSAALLINSAAALTAKLEKREILPYVAEIQDWRLA